MEMLNSACILSLTLFFFLDFLTFCNQSLLMYVQRQFRYKHETLKPHAVKSAGVKMMGFV